MAQIVSWLLSGNLGTKSCTLEEIMRAMQERIDRARDKPC